MLACTSNFTIGSKYEIDQPKLTASIATVHGYTPNYDIEIRFSNAHDLKEIFCVRLNSSEAHALSQLVATQLDWLKSFGVK